MSQHKLDPREYAQAQVRRMCNALSDFSGRNELTKPITVNRVSILREAMEHAVNDAFDYHLEAEQQPCQK